MKFGINKITCSFFQRQIKIIEQNHKVMNLAEKTIVILGYKGMLGQMITAYFKPRVKEIVHFDIRFDAENKWLFVDEIRKYPNAVIFNAIGKIKQKTEDDFELLMANTILPLELHNHLLPNQFLVHPSTDCVFDGNTNIPYRQVNESDARDTYGWSKRLGEIALQDRRRTVIFRVSIIGEDKLTNKGLLSWFLSQNKASVLNGFTNHYWNGITTLEWCKQVEFYLTEKNQSDKEGKLFQIGTQQHYTKYEMLQLFQQVYQTDYTIKEYKTEMPVDRRLYPDITAKCLKEQLQEMKEFCQIYF